MGQHNNNNKQNGNYKMVAVIFMLCVLAALTITKAISGWVRWIAKEIDKNIKE